MQRLKLYIQIIKCAMHVIGKQENESIGPYMYKIIRVNTYYIQTKLTKVAWKYLTLLYHNFSCLLVTTTAYCNYFYWTNKAINKIEKT